MVSVTWKAAATGTAEEDELRQRRQKLASRAVVAMIGRASTTMGGAGHTRKSRREDDEEEEEEEGENAVTVSGGRLTGDGVVRGWVVVVDKGVVEEERGRAGTDVVDVEMSRAEEAAASARVGGDGWECTSQGER